MKPLDVWTCQRAENLKKKSSKFQKITTQQKWYRRRADKLSAAAAARRSKKDGGGGAHKLSAAAARRGRRTALVSVSPKSQSGRDSSRLFKVPTRAKNILDMLMSPADIAYQVKVFASAVRSDIKAILATVGTPPRDRTKRQTKRTFRRRTSGQHASLLQALSTFNEADIHTDSVTDWDKFYLITTSWLDQFYPA